MQDVPSSGPGGCHDRDFIVGDFTMMGNLATHVMALRINRTIALVERGASWSIRLHKELK